MAAGAYVARLKGLLHELGDGDVFKKHGMADRVCLEMGTASSR